MCVFLCVSVEHLLTTPLVACNNSSAGELLQCFHNDDAFKYRAYTFTYLLLFPVAFLCNIGALGVFLLQSSRRSGHANTQTRLCYSFLAFSATWPKVYGQSYSVEALTIRKTLYEAGCKSPDAPRPEPDLDLTVGVVSMETVNRKPCKYML